ncbi:putative endopeptidase Clp [Emiliania huxleyi CCMP1516]|uniref:ATP-dependent Clp protease proteolytic subunit n=2 Tax=Emiliania huxleyi TaxID=2903 RepID=A0A0D3KLU6_EMIH1|nr:putative endopeptidase Clp [Emiliania huxleyi CCMP1516]EOD36731.1 putative endopeptidase Clp [Emiliania huxleyi CCMP1516]|eukprot:XP_005789160.1 putative endopeptidase Clp [Emiliania huxleyi CCMP1516]
MHARGAQRLHSAGLLFGAFLWLARGAIALTHAPIGAAAARRAQRARCAAVEGGGGQLLRAPTGWAPRRGGGARMPFGAPKVAYKVPETTSDDWVQANEPLYRERLVFLGQEIDDYVCNQCISSLLFADAEDSSEPLFLYINSPGGSVIAGLALYDTMQHIDSDVLTCNIGMAASMASFILGAGERGKRTALPSSRVMVHQPMGGSEGQAEDVRVEAEQIIKIKGTLVTMYSHMTGRTREQIVADFEGGDNYMSAEQALEYGLIDRIIGPTHD